MEFLTEQEQQYVLEVLSMRPYREVYVIISKIIEHQDTDKIEGVGEEADGG